MTDEGRAVHVRRTTVVRPLSRTTGTTVFSGSGKSDLKQDRPLNCVETSCCPIGQQGRHSMSLEEDHQRSCYRRTSRSSTRLKEEVLSTL